MTYKSNLKNVERSLSAAEDRALTAVGTFLRSEAQVRAPVDGGQLRDSINYQTNTSDKSVTLGANAEYAIFLELGTGRAGASSGVETPSGYDYGSVSGIPAQPYLRPAVETNTGRIQRLVKQMMKL